MTRPDPDTPDEDRYECTECGRRFSDVDDHECPECGGRVRNIGTPSER